MPIPNFVSSDQHEFYTPLPAVEQSARKTVSELFAFITAQGDADYIGERVSQLEHSLQCADLARKSGADDETVLGALLHDVGRFIPAAEKKEKMIWPDGTYVGIASHEVVGEEYLRHLGFSEKVCQLVGAHVMAKRYLTAVDQGYYDSLSQSSKRTLKFQVGVPIRVRSKADRRDREAFSIRSKSEKLRKTHGSKTS